MLNELKDKLRILHVNTSDLGGGAERSAWNLFRAYRQCGFNSWLATGRKYSDDPGVLVVPNELSRPRWTRLCRQVQSRGANTSLQPLAQLMDKLAWLGEPTRLIERYLILGVEDFNYPGTRHLLDLPIQRPTLVHCHNLHGNYFDLRALSWLSKQVPVIVNLRDAWLLSGHCAHSLGCERWKTGCGHCPNLTTYPAIPRDKTSYNWRRKRSIYAKSRLYVTTPSQWLMDRVQESILHGVLYRVIPNAIDLETFRPGNRHAARRVLDLPQNTQIILLIAHTVFRDLATMEAALAQASSTNRGEDLLFICLGKKKPDQPLGQGRIRYMGIERDQRRMALYYQASDVYIHAALGEVFGKTITEAMACGIPVVATAVGGIPEQVVDGVTGFLVPPYDARAMGCAIQRLLLNDDLCGRVGQAAAEHAKQQFGLDQQVHSFLGWYEEVMENWSQWKRNPLSSFD